MALKSSPKFELAAVQAWVQNQFKGLNPKDPSTWPALPRYVACLLVLLIVVILLWVVWLDGYSSELEAAKTKELAMREDYKKKLAQAVNLDALLKQREQVQQYVTQLEKQLPGKSEMDTLLSDITQAGLGRSLQFEYFRPGQTVVKDYYAELPIAIRVSGRFHEIGSFASDIANLSRIVTLNNMSVVPLRDGVLALEATAKTFRYLDASEITAQRRTAPAKSADGAKK